VFRFGERVALDARRDEGKTADDARGTTDDLLIVDLDSVVGMTVFEELLSFIRFDLLRASSRSSSPLVLVCSSIMISVGTSCTPEAAICAGTDSGRLRLLPVTSGPLSALPNQLNEAVTMSLMAPRNDELCRVSLVACCSSLHDAEEDDEDAIIIICNKSLLTRGQRKGRRKVLGIKTRPYRMCDTCRLCHTALCSCSNSSPAPLLSLPQHGPSEGLF
jgi:hypothetical protein